MPRKPSAINADYASIKVTHHALVRERADALKARPGRSARLPECLAIGHAWTEDPARDGGSICIACQVVRFPWVQAR